MERVRGTFVGCLALNYQEQLGPHVGNTPRITWRLPPTNSGGEYT